jgi:hypothetical protein
MKLDAEASLASIHSAINSLLRYLPDSIYIIPPLVIQRQEVTLRLRNQGRVALRQTVWFSHTCAK